MNSSQYSRTGGKEENVLHGKHVQCSYWIIAQPGTEQTPAKLMVTIVLLLLGAKSPRWGDLNMSLCFPSCMPHSQRNSRVIIPTT